MARQGCASSVDPIKRGLSPLSLARANSLPVPSLSFSYTQVAVLFRNPSEAAETNPPLPLGKVRLYDILRQPQRISRRRGQGGRTPRHDVPLPPVGPLRCVAGPYMRLRVGRASEGTTVTNAHERACGERGGRRDRRTPGTCRRLRLAARRAEAVHSSERFK
jgi:hypothetical protein